MLKFLLKGALLVGGAGLLLNALHDMEERNTKAGAGEDQKAAMPSEPAENAKSPAEEDRTSEEPAKAKEDEQ